MRIVGYVALIACGVTAIFLALPWPPGWLHFVIAAAFLIPGRIQGILWRSFFRGRRALGRGDFQPRLSFSCSYSSSIRAPSYAMRRIWPGTSIRGMLRP